MPAEREEMVGIHPFDRRLECQMLVAGIRDPARHLPPDREVRRELHAKPGAELFGIGERAPDASLRRAEEDGLLDAVRSGHESASFRQDALEPREYVGPSIAHAAKRLE